MWLLTTTQADHFGMYVAFEHHINQEGASVGQGLLNGGPNLIRRFNANCRYPHALGQFGKLDIGFGEVKAQREVVGRDALLLPVGLDIEL